jgi:hypothetical protein
VDWLATCDAKLSIGPSETKRRTNQSIADLNRPQILVKFLATARRQTRSFTSGHFGQSIQIRFATIETMTSPAKPKGLAAAQVAKTAEMVNYQDGAVVSREIVKRPAGSVTLFAFDEGQGLSEHTAPLLTGICFLALGG